MGNVKLDIDTWINGDTPPLFDAQYAARPLHTGARRAAGPIEDLFSVAEGNLDAACTFLPAAALLRCPPCVSCGKDGSQVGPEAPHVAIFRLPPV